MGHWEDFVATGKVEDYLHYTEEKQKLLQRNRESSDIGRDGIACAGENQCHGNDIKTSFGQGI